MSDEGNKFEGRNESETEGGDFEGHQLEDPSLEIGQLEDPELEIGAADEGDDFEGHSMEVGQLEDPELEIGQLEDPEPRGRVRNTPGLPAGGRRQSAKRRPHWAPLSFSASRNPPSGFLSRDPRLRRGTALKASAVAAATAP